MVLLHLGTDGSLHSGTDGPFLIFFFLFLSGTDGLVAFGHRWSLAFGHRWSLFNFFFSQAQMVLLHLGTDGPLHSGTDGPFLIFFFLFLSGTDGPVAFGHRWSLAFGHRWSLFNFFFPLFLSGTDGPVAFGHRWSLAFGHRWSLFSFFFPFSLTEAQMVLLHLGTDGPLHLAQIVS